MSQLASRQGSTLDEEGLPWTRIVSPTRSGRWSWVITNESMYPALESSQEQPAHRFWIEPTRYSHNRLHYDEVIGPLSLADGILRYNNGAAAHEAVARAIKLALDTLPCDAGPLSANANSAAKAKLALQIFDEKEVRLPAETIDIILSIQDIRIPTEGAPIGLGRIVPGVSGLSLLLPLGMVATTWHARARIIEELSFCACAFRSNAPGISKLCRGLSATLLEDVPDLETFRQIALVELLAHAYRRLTAPAAPPQTAHLFLETVATFTDAFTIPGPSEEGQHHVSKAK